MQGYRPALSRHVFTHAEESPDSIEQLTGETPGIGNLITASTTENNRLVPMNPVRVKTYGKSVRAGLVIIMPGKP